MFAISQTRVPTVLYGIPYEPGLFFFIRDRGWGWVIPKIADRCVPHTVLNFDFIEG